MTTWPDLVKIALLGTRRGQLDLESDHSSLNEFWQKLADDDAEHQLLSAAGGATIYQRIGNEPLKLPPQTPQASLSQDTRPAANAEISRLLATMLNNVRRDHLPECLIALHRAGRRLPPRLVPNMLALGFRSSALRPLIIPLLSVADRRLAGEHPDWLYASSAIDNWQGARRIWERSSPVSKTRFLQQLRVTNPRLGRQLLESSWKSEQASARTNFIKQLETGISLEDEPFLEMALDDRNQVVRRRAAELLAALPTSRLGQRMVGYVDRFLSWNSSGSITVRFPTISPQMLHDGIYGSRHKNPAYVRSKQLIQLVGAVPLDYWTENWHEEPEMIVQAAMRTNWKRTLSTGLADAARRQNNAPWARAILWARGPDLLAPKLIEALHTADYAGWLDHLEDQGYGGRDLNFTGPLFKSIRARQTIDDRVLGCKLMSLIARYMSQKPAVERANLSARRTFMAIAYRLPVEILPEAEIIFGNQEQFTPPWRATAEKFLNTLRFRQQMLEKVASGEFASGE